MSDIKTPAGSTSFPTMGTEAAQLSKVAKPLRGRLVPKKSGKSSSDYPEHNKANRGNVHERQGASLHPVMSHVQQNSPEASATERNIYTMPSVSSKNGQFSGGASKYC